MIDPEIGVTISQEGKEKFGGNSFYKVFGKVSVHDYRKMLSESRSDNNTGIRQVLTTEAVETNESVDVINLPAIKETKLRKKLVDPLSIRNKVKSMRSHMENLEEKRLGNEQEKKGENLFRRKKAGESKEDFDNVDKFTKQILSNKKWGEDAPNIGRKYRNLI